ncbi:hypothetical protein [Streptomyces sp. NPDC048428]|uniref:hypothetical protein n=1 Tax=Streptomyces sp. NPDC048428 TaxID=3154503 RepID=UPI003418B19E
MTAPALGSVLRAVEVPGSGGDTMSAAYDNLSASMKARVEAPRGAPPRAGSHDGRSLTSPPSVTRPPGPVADVLPSP